MCSHAVSARRRRRQEEQVKSMNSAWLTVLCSLTLSINFCCCEILLRFWKACTHLFYSLLHRRIILLSNFLAWLNNNTFVTSELCIFLEGVLRISLSFFHCCIHSESSFNNLLLFFNYFKSVYFLGHFYERELMLFYF